MDDGEAEEGELEEGEAAQDPKDTALPDVVAEGLLWCTMSEIAMLCLVCPLLWKGTCCSLYRQASNTLRWYARVHITVDQVVVTSMRRGSRS
jgi:hypothetical protein